MFDAFAQGDLGVASIIVLVLALLIAFGFEFVNGFHDTANAVATVIYTRTMPAQAAVVYSGVLNFLGVLLGPGGIAVALKIMHLLPVDLVVATGTGRGLAMVAALLVSAISWNLATWYKGLPASSSHTLIGSILGVGFANAAMNGHIGEGVSWHEVQGVLLALLVSPLFGAGLAALMMVVMRFVVRDKRVFEPVPKDGKPPLWVRVMLVATCGGVSFAHGSNDGQKGVGLVMLILVGIVPAGFAMNLAASSADIAAGRTAALEMSELIAPYTSECPSDWAADAPAPEDAAPACVIAHHAALTATILDASSVNDIDRESRWRVREGILRIDAAIRVLDETESFPDEVVAGVRERRARVAGLSEYAPLWVLFCIALSLGIGTMIGWKRIVVTVGEKIGKTHLSYAQGASAELVAASTIFAAGSLGLPVSTTHVLSSGIAGTMLVEKSGLQTSTVRNIALAWVLTLPVCMTLSGALFFVFARIAG